MAILGANTRRQGKVVKAGEGLQEVLISVDGSSCWRAVVSSVRERRRYLTGCIGVGVLTINVLSI